MIINTMGGAFFGSIIFEAIGAFFRWIFLRVVGVIKGGKPVSFKQVWDGKKDTSFQENVEHGFSNIALGVIIVIGAIVVLKLVGI
jgi:hypothetical protein